jgi:hypothetical protein
VDYAAAVQVGRLEAAMNAFSTLVGFMLMLAGVSVALWPVTHPWGTFVGPGVARTGQWVLAHTFHFLAGVFGLFGLLGLIDRQVRSAATFERLGFTVAFFGTILFASTGVFTAFVWPLLARDAPHLTEAHGPFFMPPHPVILVTSFAYSIGWALLATALMRAHVVRSWAAIVIVIGALLLLVPPAPVGPLPWVVFPIGGVLFGAGMVGLGRAVQREPAAAWSGKARPSTS